MSLVQKIKYSEHNENDIAIDEYGNRQVIDE